MKKNKMFFLSLVLCFAYQSNSAEIYVSPQGQNSNSGEINSPLKNVQNALELSVAGDKIILRAGVYKEEINFPRSNLTLQNYPGEVAVLDGGPLSPGNSQEAMILVQNKSDIKIAGLIIQNYQSRKKNVVPQAIRVEGAGKNISIVNNKIHDIKTNYSRKGSNAHAIAIYGTEAPQALENILIENNEIFDLKLGSSEAVVVNGNVDGFIIRGNYIHNSNNIAVDAIGFEGTSPDSKYDQARNGLIFGNIIHAISSRGNPAYGNSVSAGGIYIDGGRDIIIDSNTVYDSDIGVEIASEHKGKSTANVVVRNNILSFNRMAGVALGGYDRARGKTENCLILNNTFYKNNSEDLGAEIFLQYYTYNNIIKNNIFLAGTYNKFFDNRDGSGSVGNISNSNIYYSHDAKNATFEWKNVVYKGISAFQKATKLDLNSVFIDPLFENESQGNFRPLSSSFAINKGENLGPILGDVDRDGGARILDGVVDLGAFEL